MDARGSAVIEFVLVAPILLLVTVAVVQLVMALMVRSTLASAAAEGARAAALSGATTKAAVSRVTELLHGSLADDGVVAVDARATVIDGIPAIEARIDYRLAFFGLILPAVLTVEGHALVEDAR